jgi:two-component system, OmpR family, sensor kinase
VKRFLAPVVMVTLLLLGAAAVAFHMLSTPPPPVDVAQVNDLARRYEAVWPNAPQLPPDAPPHAVASVEGRQISSVGGLTVSNDLDAVRRAAYAVGLQDGERQLGTLYVAGERQLLDAHRSSTVTAVTALLVAAGLLTAAHTLWLYRRFVIPFRRLRGFATDVAAGHLVTPLAMDSHHVLGPLTESFDLLRDQLAAARVAEAKARSSKAALVDDLNHDLRSLVTAISGTAELLQLTESDPARAAKLQVIIGKAYQVGALTTDLAHAGRDELTALTVTLTTTPTCEIRRVIEECAGALPGTGLPPRTVELPDCLVEVDLTRWTQICDNVLGNAAKHGRPPVEVTGRIDDEHLQVVFRDHGPGVPEPEVDLIVRRGYRGTTAGDVPGQGLGLNTAMLLARAMRGSLHCALPRDGGLAVVVRLALSR